MKVLKFVGGSIIEMPLEIVGRQLEFYQQRKNVEHDQRLRMEEAKLMQKLELDRQKFNAELDDMVARNEIKRSTQFAKAFADYQKTMAECSVSIGKSLNMMNIEVRKHAHDLIQEKKQAYQKMQEEATNKATMQLEMIRDKFPEGSRARDIMEEAVAKQIIGIVENSMRFTQMIDDDFAKMMDSVQRITENTMNNAGQYISPAFTNNAMLRGGSDQKYLK